MYEGKEIDCAYPGIDLSKVEPILEDVQTFSDDFKGEPSTELKTYIDRIEKELEIPVGILAYGPERSEISFLKDYF